MKTGLPQTEKKQWRMEGLKFTSYQLEEPIAGLEK